MALLINNDQPEVKPNEVTAEAVEAASKDSFIHNTSFSPDAFGAEFMALSRYVSGSPISVQYYRRRIPYINKQTDSTSIIMEASSADVSYDLIKDMEIKLSAPLVPEIDPETQEAKINGKAIIYHGVKPSTGDVFLVAVADEIGIMTINHVQAMTVHKATHYDVSFNLHAFMTGNEALKAHLDESVREAYVFDAQKFFLGEAALLTSDEYTYRKKLKEFCTTVMYRFFRSSYDRGRKTIIHPDIKYDFSFVDFVRKIVSVREHREGISQLNSQFADVYHGTILDVLLTQEVGELKTVFKDEYSYRHHLWDSGLSNMDNYLLVYPVNKDSYIDGERLYRPSSDNFGTYIFSSRFYKVLLAYFSTGDIVAFDDIDMTDPILSEYEWPEEDPATTYYKVDAGDYIAQDAYVFTPETGLPDIEHLVFKYLIGAPLDQVLLEQVIDAFPYKKMDQADKFYLYPILRVLCKAELLK